MTNIKNSKNTKKLFIDGEFDDFFVFYNTNKDTIFNEIYNIYEELIKEKKECLFLDIQVIINQAKFDFSVKYNMEKFSRLTTTILQYFEENENYEMCNKIKKLEQLVN